MPQRNVSSSQSVANKFVINTSYFSFSHWLAGLIVILTFSIGPAYCEGDALEEWGINLLSNVGCPRYSKLVSGMISLPPYIKGVIVGLLLSDAWLHYSVSKGSKNCRLGFQQSLSHFGYFWHVFTLLAHFCKALPYFRARSRHGVINYSLSLQTRSLPCFTELYSLFYMEGVKVIPEDIYNLLTPAALAHWIMGDGGARSTGLMLCTDSYPVKSVVLLMNVLMLRYNLDCSLFFHAPNNTHPRIYIPARSMPRLRTIVAEHMCPSMLYKLGG